MAAAPSLRLLARLPLAAILVAVAVGNGPVAETEIPVRAEQDAASAGGGRKESEHQRLRARLPGEGGRGLAGSFTERNATGSVVEGFPSDGGEMTGARLRAGARAVQSEANSIQARDVPFLQKKEDWNLEGHGISISAKGEPKSGTTWLGRLMPQLALNLCGSPTNTWCEMGGLVVTPNEPSPWYELEMLKKDESGGDHPTLFLHFKGDDKHLIPGMAAKNPPEGCTNGGRKHRNFFENDLPCVSGQPPSREMLRSCIWDFTPECLGFNPGSYRRTAVMFRDPRDVVISERKMRLDHYHQGWVREISIDEFIRQRFENVVSWTHQRWVWHVETGMKEMSHVVFYDDLKATHLGMIDLAAFMGLECSEQQALFVWESHQSSEVHGDYTTHGLRPETIEWMNATMARLLPPVTALHWGVNPIDV